MDFLSASWHHRSVTNDPKFPSDLADRFQLRMPHGMRERLSEAAKVSGRSMNAEAVMALEAWLRDVETPVHVSPTPPPAGVMEAAVKAASIAMRRVLMSDPAAREWLSDGGRVPLAEDEGGG